MLGMMNSNTIDTVEFYAAPQSSTRQIAVSDINTFTQAKKRPHITYTNGKSWEFKFIVMYPKYLRVFCYIHVFLDGRRYVDGKLDAGQTHLEPQKTWNSMIINEMAKKQIKISESEIQRKNSTKKAVTALRKFLPFGSKSDPKSKASKTDAKASTASKSIRPQNKCITVVE